MILFLIAWILLLPLTIINFCLVRKKGYFKSTAISIDKFGNIEFRTLFNKTMITEKGIKFGTENETISSILGKNQRDKTLTKFGIAFCAFLDFIDEDHCKNSIKK